MDSKREYQMTTIDNIYHLLNVSLDFSHSRLDVTMYDQCVRKIISSRHKIWRRLQMIEKIEDAYCPYSRHTSIKIPFLTCFHIGQRSEIRSG